MFNDGSSNGIIWRYAVCTLSRLFLNSQIIKSFTKKLTFIVWIWVFVSIIWAAVLHNDTKLSSTWNVYEMWYSSNTLIWVCLCTVLIFIGFLWRLSSAIENQIYGVNPPIVFPHFFRCFFLNEKEVRCRWFQVSGHFPIIPIHRSKARRCWWKKQEWVNPN